MEEGTKPLKRSTSPEFVGITRMKAEHKRQRDKFKQFYVTRGIGTSGLSLRFLTRPELTILTLRRDSPYIKRQQ